MSGMAPLFWRWHLPAAAGVVAVAAVAASASGQTPVPDNTPPDRQTPATQPADGIEPPPGLEFAAEPFTLAQVGLSMRLPEGSRAQLVQSGEESAISILGPRNEWMLSVRLPRTADSGSTVAEGLDRTLDGIRARFGVVNPDTNTVSRTEARLIDRQPAVEIGGLPATRAYISVPRPDGTRLVHGFTFLKPGPTQFVVFELICGEADLDRVRPIYEATLRTASFTDIGQTRAGRAEGVMNGVELFASLSEADYRNAMGKGETFQRLYTPSKSGRPGDDAEGGYRGVSFWVGVRGEINPAATTTEMRTDERQTGYIAQVRGRLLHQDMIYDTMGRFFMTPDRQEEVWSLRTTVRDKRGTEIATFTETGVRNGASMQVALHRPGQARTVIQPTIEGEGYISQFEAYLLPSLLASRPQGSRYAFYAYRTADEAIVLREDVIGQDDAGRDTLETTTGEGGDRQLTTFDNSGKVAFTRLHDGRVWETTMLDELMRLWRSKGLPTGQLK